MRTSRFLAVILFFVAYKAKAQDGLFISAAPPIIVRFDKATAEVHLTNTSDKTLYGIKLTGFKDGKDISTVIIDTIEPHKTFSLNPSVYMDAAVYKDSKITCVDYSKPISAFP